MLYSVNELLKNGNDFMIGSASVGVWCGVLSAICVLIAAYIINNAAHYNRNKRFAPTGPVVNQTVGNMKKLRFGFFRSSVNGCGWIAIYNALRLMGKTPDAGKLIAELEWTGAMLFGILGTWPYSVVHYFRIRGYSVRVNYRAERYDEAAKKSEISIIWFFHQKGAHFVTVKWSETHFEGYNTFSNSKSSDNWGDSIEAFLQSRKYRPVMLISVSPQK